jgi:hypothetical protein
MIDEEFDRLLDVPPLPMAVPEPELEQPVGSEPDEPSMGSDPPAPDHAEQG